LAIIVLKISAEDHKTMKVVAFVPAKSTSERVWNKNVNLLDGTPLYVRTLEKLAACTLIDDVYLDTDSEDMFNRVRELPVKWLKRDPSLATNATDGHELFMNEVRHVRADIYVQVLCTSPFIELGTIENGIQAVSESEKYDSAVLVRRDKLYTWKNHKPMYGTGRIPNSVDLEETLIETMGLYIVRRDAALRFHRRFGERPYFLEAKPIEAVDINTADDFVLANYIASGKREKERLMLRNLQPLLSSPILSDILDDLGCKGVVRNLTPNIANARILGRAKTMKLRALGPDESYKGIYNALGTYASVIPGDVIVVENEIAEFAYFGDLNARLAHRSGAVGAIIHGATRDSARVMELGFPVFARGITCSDVRRRATIESWNAAIDVEGVRVRPGDLVFADAEGVVVIPRKLETAVLDAAMSVIKKEASITINIALNQTPEGILASAGEF
jgi:regulator of RNase E activity RraA/CMP-N-acetylneuraminic acid synthetase